MILTLICQDPTPLWDLGEWDLWDLGADQGLCPISSPKVPCTYVWDLGAYTPISGLYTPTTKQCPSNTVQTTVVRAGIDQRNEHRNAC